MIGVTAAIARYNASAIAAHTGGSAMMMCDLRDLFEFGIKPDQFLRPAT
jgi:hypothetical protein